MLRLITALLISPILASQNHFNRYLAEQRQSIRAVKRNQTVPAPISTIAVTQEIFCTLNNDCIDTSFCCSDYSCVHPSKCLHGQKVTMDTCDYNFECYSRCCDSNTCSHFLKCYKTCNRNSDCDESDCCSEGYCTHDVVCDGNKVVSDSCDNHSECLTRYCNQITHECEPKNIVQETMGIFGLVSIGVATLIFLITIAYCCKLWISTKKDSFFTSASSIGGGSQMNGT